MRWWGWGVDRDAMTLPESAQAMIRDGLGVRQAPAPRVELESIQLPASRLGGDLLDRIAATVGGPGSIRDDQLARVAHSVGRSYPDLVRVRAGQVSAPDAVVYPGSHDEVRALLEVCSDQGIAVVPFGGGTSVVGGVDAQSGSFGAVISLDLARMAALLEVDEVSLMARIQPGMTGPEAEAALAREGLTLGHLPQSWEYATIGGFAATRSAGQASTGYGRMDKLVLGLELAAPAGGINVRPIPRTPRPPPALRALVIGPD